VILLIESCEFCVANCHDKFTVAIEHNGFFTGLHDDPMELIFSKIATVTHGPYCGLRISLSSL